MSITVPPQVDLGRVGDYLTSTGLEWSLPTRRTPS